MVYENEDFDLPRTVNILYRYNQKNVDYCIDEKDLAFIESLNIKEIDLFENVMDTLDKDWFEYKQTKIQKINLIYPQEICDICTRKETVDDPMLVCQGCGISIHRDCYGSSFDKSEFFLCQCCIFFNLENTCVFCKTKGGAMKMTEDFKFGHILCVLFDNSLDFDNPISKEPIFTLDYKPIEDQCFFCSKTQGTKIACCYDSCMNVYHMGCSLDKVHYDVSNKISYCLEHDPARKNNMFISSFSLKNCYNGYVKLKERPIIRKKIRMSEWVDTDYIKIIKSEPFISRTKWSFENEINKDLIEMICKYWMYKRSLDKSYGIFYLRHTYNNNHL